MIDDEQGILREKGGGGCTRIVPVNNSGDARMRVSVDDKNTLGVKIAVHGRRRESFDIECIVVKRWNEGAHEPMTGVIELVSNIAESIV